MKPDWKAAIAAFSTTAWTSVVEFGIPSSRTLVMIGSTLSLKEALCHVWQVSQRHGLPTGHASVPTGLFVMIQFMAYPRVFTARLFTSM